MKLLLQRVWLVFDLAEQPSEVDIFGGTCTLIALPLNVTAWLNMATINGFLTILISLLSLAWLSMRVYREWGATKKYMAAQAAQKDLDDEED